MIRPHPDLAVDRAPGEVRVESSREVEDAPPPDMSCTCTSFRARPSPNRMNAIAPLGGKGDRQEVRRRDPRAAKRAIAARARPEAVRLEAPAGRAETTHVVDAAVVGGEGE